jgi:hypothetical protein
VQAIEIKGLFEVEVTALSQSREDRNAALREAMGIVLNRLMVGDNINQDATVKIALDNAASYVDQYQYDLNVDAKTGSGARVMRVAFIITSLSLRFPDFQRQRISNKPVKT